MKIRQDALAQKVGSLEAGPPTGGSRGRPANSGDLLATLKTRFDRPFGGDAAGGSGTSGPATAGGSGDAGPTPMGGTAASCPALLRREPEDANKTADMTYLDGKRLIGRICDTNTALVAKMNVPWKTMSLSVSDEHRIVPHSCTGS